MDEFGAWLAAQTCEVIVDGEACGAHAAHRQGGQNRCNPHLTDERAFALND